MITFKRFELDDIYEVAKNAIDEEARSTSKEVLSKFAQWHLDNGMAYTGFINDKPVMVTGFHKRHKNDGFLWAMITKDIKKYKKTMLRCSKALLECFIETMEVKKILAETRTDFKAAQILLEHLGFVPQRRTFNKDYIFYKRTA